MVSFKTTLLKKAIRVLMADWQRGTIEEQRARQEKLTRFNRLPAGIDCQPVQIEAVQAEWITPEKPSGTILYLHGGAYTLGSINTHRALAAALARATNTRVLLPEYHLAPEAPFPAGLDDALTVYRWLLENGHLPAEMILAGDSAGGGLVLAALLSLRDSGEPLPAGGVLFSPWTDLTLRGASHQTKVGLDFILSKPHLEKMAALYAGEEEPAHPLISPLFADLTGLPPLLIQVGTDEILLDDATRLAASAESAGVAVKLEIYPEMIHVFQMFPFFEETGKAFESIRIFFEI